MLDVPMTFTGHRIGIDVGGTKIEGILLGANGVELRRLRISTPREYHATVSAIVRLVQQLEADASWHVHATVGVGIPGTVTPSTGLVKNANSTWLIGQPLQRDLAERLARDVRMLNDADCFALSEATDGAGAHAPTVFGVILGTGVGGGVVVHGRVVQGPNLIAGEWGHNPLPWATANELPGAACYCGQFGCIETWLSGPSFARDYHEHGGDVNHTTAEIALRAQQSDAVAAAALTRYIDRLARALASVINVLDPHVIVLGGGMSNLTGLADAVSAQLLQWVFSDTVHTRVVRNMHGDASGVRGAAWLWPS